MKLVREVGNVCVAGPETANNATTGSAMVPLGMLPPAMLLAVVQLPVKPCFAVQVPGLLFVVLFGLIQISEITVPPLTMKSSSVM